jgi:hypothetical protein
MSVVLRLRETLATMVGVMLEMPLDLPGVVVELLTYAARPIRCTTASSSVEVVEVEHTPE